MQDDSHFFKTYECPKCHGDEFVLALADGQCLYYCTECDLYFKRIDLIKVGRSVVGKFEVYSSD